MHPNHKFQIADRETMAAFVREEGFGTLVVPTPDGLRAVHVPVLLEEDRLRFHVAKGNLVHSTLAGGCDALFIANGVHGYVSPDWYGMDDRVPTWNYVAVELDGPVRPLGRDALIRFLDDLSRYFETRLTSKPAWTREKLSETRFDRLVEAISGFELRVTGWRGTAKLDQDKPDDARARLAAALEANGDAGLARATRP